MERDGRRFWRCVAVCSTSTQKGGGNLSWMRSVLMMSLVVWRGSSALPFCGDV
jgi:hypothetical protein